MGPNGNGKSASDNSFRRLDNIDTHRLETGATARLPAATKIFGTLTRPDTARAV